MPTSPPSPAPTQPLPPAVLLHRYSFNDGTASDSVGGSAFAGTLMNGATVTNNQATLWQWGAYVNLPSGLFGNYTAVSIEAWVSTSWGWNSPRLFQYGSDGTSNANSIAVHNDYQSYGTALDWFDSSGISNKYVSDTWFFYQTNAHVVVSLTEGGAGTLYINGQKKGSTPGAVNPFPQPDVFYIGKSFGNDPGFTGSVNEFRIWGGILKDSDVATGYAYGPGE